MLYEFSYDLTKIFRILWFNLNKTIENDLIELVRMNA